METYISGENNWEIIEFQIQEKEKQAERLRQQLADLEAEIINLNAEKERLAKTVEHLPEQHEIGEEKISIMNGIEMDQSEIPDIMKGAVKKICEKNTNGEYAIPAEGEQLRKILNEVRIIAMKEMGLDREGEILDESMVGFDERWKDKEIRNISQIPYLLKSISENDSDKEWVQRLQTMPRFREADASPFEISQNDIIYRINGLYSCFLETAEIGKAYLPEMADSDVERAVAFVAKLVRVLAEKKGIHFDHISVLKVADYKKNGWKPQNQLYNSFRNYERCSLVIEESIRREKPIITDRQTQVLVTSILSWGYKVEGDDEKNQQSEVTCRTFDF